MILGIGTDMVDIRRVEKLMERHEQRFIERVFTETERTRAERSAAQRIPTYAKRWAAKEACAKALGIGIRDGVDWRDICVDNLANGQPGISLTGGAAARLASITPPGHTPQVHVSLTDEHPYAFSYVVISAELTPAE